MGEEDEEGANFPPSSPGESQSSSVDAIFPATKTSAPFRVVEVDATSVYSTTFSQDKVNFFLFDITKQWNEYFFQGNKTSQSSLKVDLKEESVEPIKENPKESLSPEPDVVASTKSNSLPRTEVPISLEITAPLDKETKETEKSEASTKSKKSPKKSNKSPLLSKSSKSSPNKMEPPPQPTHPVPPPRKRKLKKGTDAVSIKWYLYC